MGSSERDERDLARIKMQNERDLANIPTQNEGDLGNIPAQNEGDRNLVNSTLLNASFAFTTKQPHYYPALLDLKGRNCVVVGGGIVAERRIAGLLEAEARVTVVSPEITFGIKQWLEKGQVQCILQSYDSQYSRDAFLIIAATSSSQVNERVYKDAEMRGQLINRVDYPEQSSFIVPAVVRRGKLVIAVSTSGASPSLATEIRHKLEAAYGEEYEMYLDFLSELRLLVQEQVIDPVERRKILKDVLEQDLLAAIREGTFNKKHWLKKFVGGSIAEKE